MNEHSDEYLELADGTIIENAHILPMSETDIFLYLRGGGTMYDAFMLLSDPEKTEVITENRYKQVTVYEGYTSLMRISIEGDQITATLRRENK